MAQKSEGAERSEAAAIDNAVRLIQTYEPANIEMALRSLNACNVHVMATQMPEDRNWERLWNSLTELAAHSISIYHGAPVFPGVYEHVQGGVITAYIPVYIRKDGGFSPVRCRVNIDSRLLLALVASPGEWKSILRKVSGVLATMAAQSITPDEWKP